MGTPSSVIPSDAALLRAVGSGEREALHVLGREEQPDENPAGTHRCRLVGRWSCRVIGAVLALSCGQFGSVRGLGSERYSWEGEPFCRAFATGRL